MLYLSSILQIEPLHSSNFRQLRQCRSGASNASVDAPNLLHRRFLLRKIFAQTEETLPQVVYQEDKQGDVNVFALAEVGKLCREA